MTDIYAGAGRNTATDYEYDFTNEYLNKIRGVNFIPPRKKENFQVRNYAPSQANYISPLKQTIINSRFQN